MPPGVAEASGRHNPRECPGQKHLNFISDRNNAAKVGTPGATVALRTSSVEGEEDAQLIKDGAPGAANQDGDSLNAAEQKAMNQRKTRRR